MTWLYIARVKPTSRHPAAQDQCAPELSPTKSRIWHCGSDSSQTLRESRLDRHGRVAFKTEELSATELAAITEGGMDPRHDHLDAELE